MKKIVLLFAALLMFVPAAKSQSILVGVSGSQAFDNASIGLSVAAEIPFAKHYELDLKDVFSPVESHVSLGHGRANISSVSGIVWLNHNLGITGGAEDSMYDVTKVTKDADYAFGGLVYRGTIGGAPTRLFFQYLRQFNNGITPSGLESSHLQGAKVGFSMRFGCVGPVCVRNTEDFTFGRVLTQGNPYCDGTISTVECGGVLLPRTPAFGGGVTASINIEFPRRRGHENDVF